MHSDHYEHILSAVFYPKREVSRSRATLLALLLVNFAGILACSDDASDHNTPAAGGSANLAGATNTISVAGAKSTADTCPSCAGSGGTGSAGLAVSDGVGGSTTVTEPDPELPYFDASRVIDVQIEMDGDSWDALRSEGRTWKDVVVGADCLSSPFENPYTWKRATVTVDGVTRSNVGLRKKGFLGSLDSERPSLKVAFDQFDAQTLFGVRDLTLNNVVQDPAVISQCLGYAVFAKAGLPAPRCNFAHVTVNGQNLGVYTHVDPVKKPFLRRHFDSDMGDLYEGTVSDFREGWIGTFDPKTSETDPEKVALRAVAKAVNAPPSQLLSELGTVVDLDAFAAFWATEVLIAHLDGYARNINNFYVYRRPSTGKLEFIPWGADMIFGNNDATATTNDPMGKYTQGIIAHALYSTTDGRSRLFNALESVLEKAWNESELASESQRMSELIYPHLGPAQSATLGTGLQALRQFITNRRATLLKAIANPPTDAQPLRPYACFQPVGTVSGTFSTTWQATVPENPFATGTATLEVSLNGGHWDSLPGQIGAYAALNPDPSAAQDSQLVVPAILSNGKIGVVAFGLDQTDAKPGTIALDLDHAAGMLLELDPSDSNRTQVLGIAAGGSLVFDAAGTTSGAPIAGHFSAEVYYTPLLNGF